MCEDTRGTPKKQHYWIWRSLCSRTANQIASKTILLSLSLFPLPLFSVVLVWTELEKRKYPSSSLSLSLSLSLSFCLSCGGINSEKMSLWYSTRPEWPDSSNCEYTSLLLSLPHRHTLTPTCKQHTNSLIVILNKNRCIFSHCFLTFAKTLYSVRLTSDWLFRFALNDWFHFDETNILRQSRRFVNLSGT